MQKIVNISHSLLPLSMLIIAVGVFGPDHFVVKYPAAAAFFCWPVLLIISMGGSVYNIYKYTQTEDTELLKPVKRMAFVHIVCLLLIGLVMLIGANGGIMG